MKTVSVKLSHSSIDKAIKSIETYKRNLLERKCKAVVDKLLAEGIQVAKVSTGPYAKYIAISKKIEPSIDGCTELLVATNTGYIVSEWLDHDTKKVAVVNPLLMAEFGSGPKADNAHGFPFGFGQGSFPGQTHAHENSWWWKDLDEKWHRNFGSKPTYPLLNAQNAMVASVDRVMREVFGSD